VPLLNPKFAAHLQHNVCELRVRGTKAAPDGIESMGFPWI
jgi:hypothetical protein